MLCAPPNSPSPSTSGEGLFVLDLYEIGGIVETMNEVKGWHHDCGFYTDSDSLMEQHVEECQVVAPVAPDDVYEILEEDK